MDPAQFMITTSKDQDSPFAKQLNECLQSFREQLERDDQDPGAGHEVALSPLVLTFHDCEIHKDQVQLLMQRVYAISQVNIDHDDHEDETPLPKKYTIRPLHLSLQNCHLAPEALPAWEFFLDEHVISHLSLLSSNPQDVDTSTFLHTTMAHTARHLQSLHLACQAIAPSMASHETSHTNSTELPLSIPHILSATGPALQRIHLERLHSKDIAAFVELLAEAQRGKDCPLLNIPYLTMTHTTLSSKDLSQLVGGLLAHRQELTHVKLGLEYCLSLTADEALPSLGLLWTEFPHLKECHIDLRHCPRLLHDQLNTADRNDPNSQYYNPQQVPTIPASIHQWGEALQASRIPHVSWTMHQVGLREDVVLALLPYAAAQRVSCLDWRDQTLIATERFVFQLATLLPHWKGLERMVLHDLTPTELSDYSFASWWTDDNESLLVEGLEANETIHEFEFRIGGGHVPVLSPENLRHVEEKILQRNRNKK